jgi:hypothetical protein
MHTKDQQSIQKGKLLDTVWGHTQKTSYCSSFHWSKKSRKWQHVEPGNLLKSPNLLRQPHWWRQAILQPPYQLPFRNKLVKFSNVKLLWRSEGSRSQTIEVPAPLSDTEGNIGGRSLIKYFGTTWKSTSLHSFQHSNPSPKTLWRKMTILIGTKRVHMVDLVYSMSFQCSTFLLDFAAQVPLLLKLPHVVSSLSLSLSPWFCLCVCLLIGASTCSPTSFTLVIYDVRRHHVLCCWGS